MDHLQPSASCHQLSDAWKLLIVAKNFQMDVCKMLSNILQDPSRIVNADYTLVT